MALRRASHAALVAAAIVLVSSACGDSPEPGETEVADLPGVRRVDVMLNDGDNDIPEEPTPEHVTVVMKGDATLAQISAVFDAYAKEIDSGKITGVRVILQGPKRASVATGAGIHATEPLIQDLLDAQQDQAIIGYRRQDYPVLPSVELTMAADGFDSMLAMADRYRAPGEIDYVAVVSGDFILMRDAVNGNPARGAAREEFTRQVDGRFHLTGCVVDNRGVLRLLVVPSEAEALRQYVVRNAPRQVGGVTVHANAAT